MEEEIETGVCHLNNYMHFYARYTMHTETQDFNDIIIGCVYEFDIRHFVYSQWRSQSSDVGGQRGGMAV